jgi:hypothetical protein
VKRAEETVSAALANPVNEAKEYVGFQSMADVYFFVI